MPEQFVPIYHGASGEFYQGVVTVSDAGKEYYCTLCGVTCYSQKEWQIHMKSSKHESRVVEARDLLRHHFQLRDVARTKCSRTLALQHVPWQDAVFAKMGRVLVNDEDDELITKQVDDLLHELELLETISLLELAVWKGLCCANCPSHVAGYFGFQSWLKEGWKTIKDDYRRCDQVVAIMRSVMPFIDRGEKVPSAAAAAAANKKNSKNDNQDTADEEHNKNNSNEDKNNHEDGKNNDNNEETTNDHDNALLSSDDKKPKTTKQ